MNKNLLKGLSIGFSIILFSTIAMYLGLAYYYRNGFSYNTWINGVYCTGKSIDEVNKELLQQCDYQGLTIIDYDGKSYHIASDRVSLHYDYREQLVLYLQKQNSLLWIDNLIHNDKNRKFKPTIDYDKEELLQLIHSFPFYYNAPDSTNKVSIELGDNGYYLQNERSHVLNKTKTENLILTSFEEFTDEINLEAENCYEDLPLNEEMEETLYLWQKIDDFQQCNITYVMGEDEVEIDSSITCNFMQKDEDGKIILDENGQLIIDESKVNAFVDILCDQFDTVDGIRYFHATRGETVKVKGGTYGNKINREAEKEYLLQAFIEGRNERHTPQYLQKALVQGKEDIGSTYIEVDIKQQKLYYYKDGNLLLQADVVTGNTSLKRDTPEGTMFVYGKQKNRILRGADYATPVKYWIPVYKAIGIHDASWRKEFGGSIYKTNGSHGCVNTPTDKVAALYDMVEIGTPCIIFY